MSFGLLKTYSLGVIGEVLYFPSILKNSMSEGKWNHTRARTHTPYYTNASSHLSLNREGRWGTTDDFATSFLHFSLFTTALWDLADSRPVHSLMLSSHLFHCLPCLLPPFTVLQDGFGQTWWTGDMSIPLQFASLYDGQEVFVWSDCLLGAMQQNNGDDDDEWQKERR